MKTIKTILPLLIGLFIIIGGINLLNMQQAEARNESKCNYLPWERDCITGGIGNCICVVVEELPEEN